MRTPARDARPKSGVHPTGAGGHCATAQDRGELLRAYPRTAQAVMPHAVTPLAVATETGFFAVLRIAVLLRRWLRDRL